MIAAIIEACDLVKRFNGFTAVDHISFAVPEGVIFGFLGPNGAGKTTTIKMLTTVLTPSEGRLLIAGHDPVKEPLLVRRAFGIVFQDPSLDGELTAAENWNCNGVTFNDGSLNDVHRAAQETLVNQVRQGIPVSAHGSASERNCALAYTICLTIANRSKVLRASRSMRVTVTTSPGARALSILRSSRRSLCAPVTFSR
jgi:ABC-type Fe3+/spermidine/putrescine transport system ATPase subunit